LIVREHEVFESYRGLGVWLVRQPFSVFASRSNHTYQVVHRGEDGTETVLGSYSSFDEAFWEASRLADEAHLKLVDERSNVIRARLHKHP